VRRRVAEREGQERAEALEYTKWIGELMLEGGVRSLPWAPEVLGAGAGFESVLGEHWARQVRNYFAEFDKRKRKAERWQVACTS
jgi:hypothetical protein